MLARVVGRLGALWATWVVRMGADGVETRSAALQSRDLPIFSPVLARVSACRWSKVGLDLRFGTHNFAALARDVEHLQRVYWGFQRGGLVTR